MPRHLIKRITPDHKKIREHRYLRMFGTLLHDPNLWHLNRRSVSGAFAIGLFWSFMPMPFQTIAAAACAIPARVNLPLSVALVFISNPITMPPMYYFNYLVGHTLIGSDPQATEVEMSLHYIWHSLSTIWQPLLLGSLVCGLVAGVVGYCVMRGLWRLHVVKQWQQRRRKPSGSADRDLP